MQERLDRAARALVRPVAAGSILLLVEAAVVIATGRELFLGLGEVLLYVGAAGPLLVTTCVTLWALASAILRLFGAARPIPPTAPVGPTARRAGLAAALVLGPAAGAASWALSEGRRLRDLPARPALVTLGAISAAAILFWVVARLVRRARAGDRGFQRAVASFAAGVGVAALVADATVLRRLYPSLHWTLAGAATCAVLLSAASWPHRTLPRARGLAVAVAIAAAVCAPLSLSALRDAPNASFVVERSAPLTGKVVRLLRRSGAAPPRAPSAPRVVPPREAAEGIDLRGRSVLVVTVDALRADRLGGGLTPAIDALARDGVLFRRAYTTTPHTSYAIASLLTGKYMRLALDLPGAGEDHPTVADLLGRAGFHTAAFHPPAVFFVDEDRFGFLAARGLGFAHREEGFEGAARRVEQVREHLESIGADRPAFFWVHFFEPHEPYDPPPGLSRGDSAEERYDGEVAEVDEAVGRLVGLFRSLRPNATVIVTADHGEEHGEHGGRYHGTTLHDEQVRVPLVWSSPGVAAIGANDVPVDLPDVTVTLLAALGVPRDARMRGDDLGPVLAGHVDLGPSHAFGSVGDEHMVTDGRLKAICAVGDTSCRLYDLAADPGETRNLAEDRLEDVRRLRGALAAHLASIPRVESRAADTLPDALARAAVGDPTVGPDLVPLLGARDPTQRIRAARAIARLGHMPAGPILLRLREDDPDDEVRAEAAVAALSMGLGEALGDVRARVRDEDLALDVRRRGALALARRGDAAGTGVLVGLSSDEEADEALRVAAIRSLAELGSREAVGPLTELLSHLRLRTVAADALGRIGDRRAARPLAEALEEEPYLPARAAEAEALVRLGHRRAEPLVRRWLGAPTPLPDGVLRLVELGALRRPTGGGADLRHARRAQEGSWRCDEGGCRVGADAALVLPAAEAPRGPARAVLRVLAGAEASVSVGAERREVRPGPQEIAFDLERVTGPRRLEIRTTGDVRLVALAVVDAVE